MRIVVTGAGGFIGHHLVNRLKAESHWVRGVDIKPPEFAASAADEFLIGDLRHLDCCLQATEGMEEAYQLAADMGGIGYITANLAKLTRSNTLINCHMLEAARVSRVSRFLYTSSACVYPSFLQVDERVTPLRESEAVPADPEKGYGWEKLFGEQLTSYFHEEFELDVRIVRFHNIYGPLGTYEGGREKAPAAICRKVALASDGDSIEVWGDGLQTRSFCYIDDCIEGLLRIMVSGFSKPVNLGTRNLVTVNELVETICRVAGKTLIPEHDLTKPQGVRGRNSDNTLLQDILGWEPQTTLRVGIEITYPWVAGQLASSTTAQSEKTSEGVSRSSGSKVKEPSPQSLNKGVLHDAEGGQIA